MAILATLPIGLLKTPTRCYVRVARVTATVSTTMAIVEILSEDRQTPLESRQIVFQSTAEPGSPNHIEQAYEQIKDFADFQGVEDC